MDLNDDFVTLHKNLKEKTREIEKIIKNYQIPTEARKKIKSELSEMKGIFTRAYKRIKPSSRTKKGPGGKVSPGIKNTRIEVLDNTDRKQTAFYMEKDSKPDKIKIESTKNCKRVKLKITSGKFAKFKTIHLFGDTKEDEIKFMDTDKNKEITKE